MKTMLKNLLLLALNVFAYALCWGVYWLCWACWWLATSGVPAAGRWTRDKALPRLGELLLALVLDAVAFVVWLAWLFHDPKAATRQTRERLMHAGASAAAWLVSLAYRAVAGASYAGKCRRPVLCPVAARVGLPEFIEQTDIAGDLVPAIDPPMPSSPLGVAESNPSVEDVAGDHETATAGSVESPPFAEPVPALLAYHAALPAVPLLAYSPAVGQSVSVPANVEEPVVSSDSALKAEPPIAAEQPRPSPSRQPVPCPPPPPWSDSMALLRTLALAILAASLAAAALPAQTPKEADAAYSEGVKHVNAREYKEAIEPLERALALAPDDAYRLKVYRALVPAYRTLPGPEKMIESCEFILRHSDQLAERRATAASLSAFFRQRGLADAQLKRYGELYDKDNEDFAALAMSSELAKVTKVEKATAEAYRERHRKAERKLAGTLAAAQEELAGKDKAREAWCWKEAAVLWVAAGDRPRALAAAAKAEAAGPEKRDLLTHFWHAQLGDVYADGGKYAEAVKHFERAIEATTIKGYQDACRLKAEDAKKKLAEKP